MFPFTSFIDFYAWKNIGKQKSKRNQIKPAGWSLCGFSFVFPLFLFWSPWVKQKLKKNNNMKNQLFGFLGLLARCQTTSWWPLCIFIDCVSFFFVLVAVEETLFCFVYKAIFESQTFRSWAWHMLLRLLCFFQLDLRATCSRGLVNLMLPVDSNRLGRIQRQSRGMVSVIGIHH